MPVEIQYDNVVRTFYDNARANPETHRPNWQSEAGMTTFLQLSTVLYTVHKPRIWKFDVRTSAISVGFVSVQHHSCQKESMNV